VTSEPDDGGEVKGRKRVCQVGSRGRPTSRPHTVGESSPRDAGDHSNVSCPVFVERSTVDRCPLSNVWDGPLYTIQCIFGGMRM
jgi:hypothetical protein